MKAFRVLGVLVGAGLLGGCAAPVIGAVTVGELATGASVVTMAVDGKGLTEVAMDAATGRDCRILEGVVRANRTVCEEPGSPPTHDDFRGLRTVAAALDAPAGGPVGDRARPVTHAAGPGHRPRSMAATPYSVSNPPDAPIINLARNGPLFPGHG